MPRFQRGMTVCHLRLQKATSAGRKQWALVRGQSERKTAPLVRVILSA